MRFSILMCTWNSAATLRQAVCSVRNQSFSDWELIILDNGSWDETVEILKEYQQLDERIVCIYRKDNVGWPRGISICLGQVRGEYMMFLGADDLLAEKETLWEIEQEIARTHPDILWTGYGLADFSDGTHRIMKRDCPPYQVYQAKDKVAEIAEIMHRIYYNSVMHYVRIDFLKIHGIDFYEPFYGDCMGMTEALCKADKMVVLNRVAYILTVNTSQTASRTGFDYDIGRQWNSIKETANPIQSHQEKDIRYIAERIFRNLETMYENILLGGLLRNRYMNPIERTIPERFLKAEEWISSDAFGEMLYYAGRRKYQERMLGAAGILFWACRKQERDRQLICSESHWLAEYVKIAFECDVQGNVQWKQKFTEQEADTLLHVIACQNNRHRIGAEMLLREDVVFEDISFSRKLEEVLADYLKRMPEEIWT